MSNKQPSIVDRLRASREQIGSLADEAADMLEFFFQQLQMHSPKMDGQHSYRFRSSGWPMTHCIGPSAEEAVQSAIAEIKAVRDSLSKTAEFCQHIGLDHRADRDSWTS